MNKPVDIEAIRARHELALTKNVQFGDWNYEPITDAHNDRAALLAELAKRDALLNELRDEAQICRSYRYTTDNGWIVKRIDRLLGEKQ